LAQRFTGSSSTNQQLVAPIAAAMASEKLAGLASKKLMNAALPDAPPPISPLGRYRLLSPNASLWVSPLCLGTMNFGNAW
jgi:hypothetical protein